MLIVYVVGRSREVGLWWVVWVGLREEMCSRDCVRKGSSVSFWLLHGRGPSVGTNFRQL